MASHFDDHIYGMTEADARSILGEDFAYAIALGVPYCLRCARDARASLNTEHYAAYRTAVHIAQLIAWIRNHDGPESTRYNGDGTITVVSIAVDASGQMFPAHDVIPATMCAARDLLGY